MRSWVDWLGIALAMADLGIVGFCTNVLDFGILLLTSFRSRGAKHCTSVVHSSHSQLLNSVHNAQPGDSKAKGGESLNKFCSIYFAS